MTELPRHGVTVRAHVIGSVASAEATLMLVRQAVQESRRLFPAQRGQLSRDLAGVIAECESVRLWLDAGCPEG